MTHSIKPVKRGPGRPPEYTMPPRIDAPPVEFAKAFLRKPPKEWRYPKKHKEPTN